MKDVRDVVEENHMYIRIASNDFFAVSKDVVSKMIAGEYTAQQAYRAFNAQLLAEEDACRRRDRADLREELFQCLPRKRRQRLLLRYGEHAARRLWHGCAARHRKQLYRQCAAGGL